MLKQNVQNSDFAFSPQLGILIGSLILWQIKLSTNSSSIAKPLALALTIILAHSYPKYPGRAPKPVYE